MDNTKGAKGLNGKTQEKQDNRGPAINIIRPIVH